MKTIDESKLESDVQYRYEFLAEFIGFGPEDEALIQAFVPHLGPKVGELVEKTYEKLLAFDITAQHFVSRQHGFEGDAPAKLSELGPDHPQIRFRKDHLNRYFMQLVTRAYDEKMVKYLDTVGKIHTPGAGNQAINVPLVQMNALIGLMADMLLEFVATSPLDAGASLKTQRAFSKLLWIQNDFVQRHYV